jgi:Tol biopolymer transport system component
MPQLSPTGELVAASLFNSHGPALLLYSRAAGKPSKFFDAAKVSASAVAWSADSRYLAVILQSTTNAQTSRFTTVSHGNIQGASFSPSAPYRIAYGRSSAPFAAPADVYTTGVDGTGTQQLTRDHRSLNPLWGAGTIVFDRERLRGKNAPAYQIWQMAQDGSSPTQITHVAVPKLDWGLVPKAISADGERLLAEYGGQDTRQAWTVAISTRRARMLRVGTQSVMAFGISRDGTSILTDVNEFQNTPSDGKVTLMPFGGGHTTALVSHAIDPSWNR